MPILVDGEAVLYESLAILQYLENFYPDKPLLPANRVKHALAQVRMQVRLALINALIKALIKALNTFSVLASTGSGGSGSQFEHVHMNIFTLYPILYAIL